MSTTTLQGKVPEPAELSALLRPDVPFGPAFLLTQLAAFVRDRCPAPTEALPHVHIHLAGGEVLELCHVIALAPRWAAFAIIDASEDEGVRPMRTELVPYELLVRITVRASPGRGGHIGFHQVSPPTVHATPEEMLQAAASLRAQPGVERPGVLP